MDSTTTQWRFREGDTVFGSDGQKLGKVVGFFPDYTNPQYLIVEKGIVFSHDYYVPVSAVANYTESDIFLDVTKDEALHKGWDQRPIGVATTAGGDAPPAM
jgi:hypothetical protein